MLLYMNGRLSKFRSVHTYVIPRTVFLVESVIEGFEERKEFSFTRCVVLIEITGLENIYSLEI